ncbi:hypothetical protein HO173_007759 [Letharia columbiana]|uniref:Uncharacterized protein n=1 Tax=Letharia columbiana TaxID=112416 RepID=A0A8H6FSG2_9LECA|nr:uncharacterized protein HO173_007759 [Letharia columbiana]KAF6233929.1 hypothetical protein HO173_007759 [Letharia columbiana]
MASKSPVPLDSDGFPVVTSPITGKYVLHRSGSDTVHLLRYTLAEESFNEPFDTFQLRSALVIGLQKELDSFQEGTTLREVLLQGGSALEDARKLAKETQLVKKILDAGRRSETRAATETSEQRQERLRRHALVQNPPADEQRGEDSAKRQLTPERMNNGRSKANTIGISDGLSQ